MAMIPRGEGSVARIREFLGLNENPDGDTHLLPGELAELRNFRITREKHLQIRPGQRTLMTLRTAWEEWAKTQSNPVKEPRFCGAFRGFAAGEPRLLAAFGGGIFSLDLSQGSAKALGSCTQDETHFFGFGDKIYLLNGHEYLCWDGGADTAFETVEGYIPTVMTATEPSGLGVSLEKVNRLTGKRRVKFSPDGKASAYHLPEREVDELVSVKGTSISYTLDGKEGIVNFSSAPQKGTNTLEIVYRKGQGKREEVTKMHFSELYNGITDARVFLYGDGSNKTIYSGNDLERGVPTAEYFPDLYEAAVGDANSPITGMIRHYGRLLLFKPQGCWAMDIQLVNLPAGGVTAAFQVSPVNRQLGCEAPGQVRLLENDPLTLDCGAVYQWGAVSVSGGDRRTARRISDRVSRSLARFDFSKTRCCELMDQGELWFLHGGEALIFNHFNNSWYRYDGIPFETVLNVGDKTLGFAPDGRVIHFSRAYRSDDGSPIDAYAETGSMDFGRNFTKKCSPRIYTTLLPESGGRITVTAETNLRGDYPERLVSVGLSGFTHVDFNHFSFGTNRKPQARRVKLHVGKASYYKLIFKSCSASAAATVLETDIRMRYTGEIH